MDILKQADLKQLTETSGEWCVSLYMPTHRFGREQQQDPIRLKNLVINAEKILLETGLDKPEVQELLRPANDFLKEKELWQHQSDGLAVFLSPDFSRIFRLPSSFDELLVVSNNFQIKPLLPLLTNDGKFYVLALSMNEVRLFLGTRHTIDEVDLGDIPANIKEALWMDDPEKYTGFHTGTGRTGGDGTRHAVYYGHGDKESQEKTNILRFFQQVNRGLDNLLDVKDIPMVLAGVNYLLPIYHKASTYSGLLDKGLEGNPEELGEDELHKRAWELIRPIVKNDQKQALERFKQLAGQGDELASVDLKTIVEAANFGRVDTLIVPLGVQIWGRYDSQLNKVYLEQKPEIENQDLLDFAAIHTLSNSGIVYAVRPEDMPGDGELAAIFRYVT